MVSIEKNSTIAVTKRTELSIGRGEMKQWETGVDIAIRKAMEAGEFDNLPGEGQPIDLSIDPYAPADMQLAFKIMKQNGIAPDWIVQGKTLKGAHKAYKTSKNVAVWFDALEKLGEDAAKLNKEIVAFNLKLPTGFTHQPLINMERAIERLGAV